MLGRDMFVRDKQGEICLEKRDTWVLSSEREPGMEWVTGGPQHVGSS